MNRRNFCISLAAGTGLSARAAKSDTARITRARVSMLTGRFHKEVAMNAYDKAPKGRTYQHVLIRIETNRGIEGIGAGTYDLNLGHYAPALQFLIGKNPHELYQMANGRITGVSTVFKEHQSKYRYLDGPLFDLIGKLENKPAWSLLGPSVRETIECYDGTLYFSDVMHPERGVASVVAEAKEAVESGFKAIKLKTGRGSKWMERKAGNQRDIDVVHEVRQAVGPHVLMMVDHNNGYDNQFDAAWRFVEETKADNLHWIEEPFRESVEGYARLKDKMATIGVKTLIADGENLDYAEQLKPYLAPRRLMDVLQLDIRRSGFLMNADAAKLGESAGAVSIPHNWASQIGHAMGLHLAKASKNTPWAEDERSTCDVLHLKGYTFAGSKQTASNEPGLGLSINEDIYNAQCKSGEQIVS